MNTKKQNQGVPQGNVNVQVKMYTNGTAQIKTDKLSTSIDIEREARITAVDKALGNMLIL